MKDGMYVILKRPTPTLPFTEIDIDATRFYILHSYPRIKAWDLPYSLTKLCSPQRTPSTMLSGLQTLSTLQGCKKIKIESHSVPSDINRPMEHVLFLILLPPSHSLQIYRKANKIKIELPKLSPINNPASEACPLPNPNKASSSPPIHFRCTRMQEIKIASKSIPHHMTQPVKHVLFLLQIKPTPTLPSTSFPDYAWNLSSKILHPTLFTLKSNHGLSLHPSIHPCLINKLMLNPPRMPSPTLPDLPN